MKLYDSIAGIVCVEICGAFPAAAVNACAAASIPLRELKYLDPYTLSALVREKDLPALEAVAGKVRCELRVRERRGGSQNLLLLKRRVWLLLFFLLNSAALLVSSCFVWDFRILGCERLSEGQVRRALADCGMQEGSFWPGLSADLLRSRMLEEMPEIAWMTVNVSGSRATVLISERRDKPDIYREDAGADIVAGRTGIIRELSVLNGRALKAPGEIATEGEILISGKLENLSGAVRHVNASGSVTADTWYELTAVRPLPQMQKGKLLRRFSRYALKIGRWRINFYRNGKKTLDGYDRIVHEYKMGWKGLFALPVTVIREECQRYDLLRAETEIAGEMRSALREELQGRIDGEILSASFIVSMQEDRALVTLRAQCCENIARRVGSSGARATA